MDLSTVSQLVASLGFPIVMCFYLVYSQERLHKMYNEQMQELTTLINNNTLALSQLTDKLEDYGLVEKEDKHNG